MLVLERDKLPASGDGRRRRRRWADEEKRRIVAEADAPGASVSIVARRYDLNANMLFTWRRQLGIASVPSSDAAVTFVPAEIGGLGQIAGPDLLTSTPTAAEPISAVTGRMEIVLAHGDRVIAGSDVDAAPWRAC